MKKYLILTIVLATSVLGYGQNKVFSVQELTQHGLSMQQLDSVYKNSLPGSDSITPLFNQAYFDSVVEPARIIILKQLGKYLSNNDFKWGGPIRCWNRMYINTNGDIDYFVYRFISPVDPKQELEFKRLVNLFLKDYQTSIQTTNNYSICGGIVWKD